MNRLKLLESRIKYIFYTTARCSYPISYFFYSTKSLFKMNTAYFRHVDGEEYFNVTFRLVNNEIGIDKNFNFRRRITEDCNVFLTRVNVNVGKVLDKKKKKGKKNKEHVEAVLLEVLNPGAELLINNQPVNLEYPCKEIFNRSASYTLKILNCFLPVEINVPWVDAIALPKGVMAGFLVYPSKFESYFVESNLSKWTWYRSTSRQDPWIECGSGAFYETVCDDVNQYLRVVCEPNNRTGESGPPVEAISLDAVTAGPGPLPCEERQQFTTCKLDDSGLRIVSYNLLADLYVDSEYSRTVLFCYCATYALDFSYRKQLLIKELMGYNADILAMQEVDLKMFKYDLEPLLASKNMKGKLSLKGTVTEGTAVFYNVNKFNLLQSWNLLLADELKTNNLFAHLWAKICEVETFASRITERSTTLQVLLLERLAQPDHLLLVANIHLYFHPDADHIRLLQAILCISYLESLIASLQNQYSKKISLVWCGDFNSVPECGIYQLLTSGSVSCDHPDWSSNTAEAIKTISYNHALKLASACGTPEFTNYTMGFKACLDYIFYDAHSFNVSQVVPLPDEDVLAQHMAIPSIVFPSDHIALVADLQWKN